MLKQVISLSRTRSGAVKAMSGKEELLLATLINTSEYCSEVMGELEALLRLYHSIKALSRQLFLSAIQRY